MASRSLLRLFFSLTLAGGLAGCGSDGSKPPEEEPPPFGGVDPSLMCPAGQIGWDFSTGGGRVEEGAPTTGRMCIPAVCSGKTQRDAKMACVANDAIAEVTLPSARMADGRFWMEPASTDYAQNWIRKTGTGSRSDYRETLEVFGGHWGGWKGMVMCPAGYYGNGYRLRVEGPISGDDTAMNAVQINCVNPQGQSQVITSHDGAWGDWRQWQYCASGKYLNAVNMKYEDPISGDDTAGNDLGFFCGDERTGLHGGGGGEWGGWKSVVTCGRGRTICGVESRFEDPTSGDDTAMNGLKIACCDAPGTGATAANSFRPLYQEVPYRYTARVPAAGQPFKTRLALWVTKRFVDGRVTRGLNPSDPLPPAEAFVCTLTNLDVQKPAAGEALAQAASRAVGEIISPECVQGLRDARKDFESRQKSRSLHMEREQRAGRITREQFETFLREQERSRWYEEDPSLVLHLSFDPMGDTYIPPTTAANTILRYSTGGTAPNPPGFYYQPEWRWVDMIAFYQQREIKVPWIGPNGETTGQQSSLLHDAAASAFDLPTKLLLGIKDFKLESSALTLNPFEPSPPSVTVDIDWMAYGDIEANPYSARAQAQRLPDVKPPTERNLRATVEIRPTNTTLTWKNIGSVPLNKDTQVATGSVKSAAFFPDKKQTKDLFSQSSGAWRSSSMFDVRVCLDADGINARPESGSTLRLPPVNAGGFLFSAGFESGDKGCVTKTNALAITRDFLLRPIPPQRSSADVGMVDTAQSGGEDASGANDNGGEKLCMDTTAGRRCESESTSSMGGKGFFGRAFYDTETKSSQTENTNGSGSASAATSANMFGFEVIDLDDEDMERGWASEVSRPQDKIEISIEPNWDIIIDGLEMANPPGPPPKPRFMGKPVGGRMGLGVGVGFEATVQIGPIPGRLVASFGIGFSVSLEFGLAFQPDSPYPCTGDSNNKCFAASTDRKNQKDAAEACADKGARLAEIRSVRDRDGIMAAADGDQNYWIGGQLAYQYADLNCADPAATNVDREWCKRESETSYRWMGSDREIARSRGLNRDVEFFRYAQIPARPPGGVHLATAVPTPAGLAYQGAYQKIVTIPQDASLPYVCEFDGVAKTKYIDVSLGLKLAVGVGLAIGFYIPNENFGFGIEGTVDFITVSLTPTVGYREFTLYDNSNRWLGTRGSTYTEGPWEVSLLSCGISAVANFIFWSAKWSLLSYPGYKVAGGKLWDVSWPTRQVSAMRPEPPVEAPTEPTPLPEGQRVALVEGETTNTEHQVGRVDGDGWSANVGADNAGYLISGPETWDVPAGKRMATYRMKIDNNQGSDHIARLEVVDAWDGRFYASRDIYRSDFFAANTYVEFALLFDAPSGRPIRFRVYWTDRAAVTVDRITAGAQRTDLRGDIVVGHGHWGDWQGARYCPEDSYATGYRMKVEGQQGGGDDTALNSVELQCTDREGGNSILSAHPGHWGNWNGWRYCTNNSFIKSGALKVEGTGGDDTSANSVKVQCTDGSEMEAPGGAPWGGWSGFAACPAGQAVCGIEARIEAPQGGGDDTAMNGLKFVCCEYERRSDASTSIDLQVEANGAGSWAGTNKHTATCAAGSALAGISRPTNDNWTKRALCGRFPGLTTGSTTVMPMAAESRRAQRLGDWAPNFWKMECGLNEHVSGIARGSDTNSGIQAIRCSAGGGTNRGCEYRLVENGSGHTGTYGDWDPNYFKSDCPANKAVVGVSMTVNTARATGVLCCEL
jgi:hypothetical protein